MRIGVISDSHGNQRLVEEALSQMGEIDALFHAGDYEFGFDPDEYPYPVYVAKGNCDPYDYFSQEGQTVSLAEIKIFLTHGDLYDARRKIAGLKAAAQQEDAQVVIYGHSHIAFSHQEDGILFLNPGSLARPRSTMGRSYAILTVNNGGVSAEIFPLRNN